MAFENPITEKALLAYASWAMYPVGPLWPCALDRHGHPSLPILQSLPDAARSSNLYVFQLD
jgi:hypothetical protein